MERIIESLVFSDLTIAAYSSQTFCKFSGSTDLFAEDADLSCDVCSACFPLCDVASGFFSRSLSDGALIPRREGMPLSADGFEIPPPGTDPG